MTTNRDETVNAAVQAIRDAGVVDAVLAIRDAGVIDAVRAMGDDQVIVSVRAARNAYAALHDHDIAAIFKSSRSLFMGFAPLRMECAYGVFDWNRSEGPRAPPDPQGRVPSRRDPAQS